MFPLFLVIAIASHAKVIYRITWNDSRFIRIHLQSKEVFLLLEWKRKSEIIVAILNLNIYSLTQLVLYSLGLQGLSKDFFPFHK